MSSLQPGDEDMHHSDGSHRWIAPPDVDQDLWTAFVREHQQRHLAGATTMEYERETDRPVSIGLPYPGRP